MTPRTELPGPNDWHVVPAGGGFAVMSSRRFQDGRIIALFAAAFKPEYRQRPSSLSLALLKRAKVILGRSA